MASTLVNDEIPDLPDLIVTGYGGTFRAWGHIFLNRPQDISACGSYGRNGALNASQIGRTRSPGPVRGSSTDVRVPSRVPVMLDSTWLSTSPGAFAVNPPPESDAIPTAEPNYERVWKSCINRHDGGVNCSFFDGSVRKVGLKELWTLKWWPNYNTANPWTKAGGVQPGDWPEWMRHFRDH
jgi:prepilin-type processing-associated H-X9-DG protein